MKIETTKIFLIDSILFADNIEHMVGKYLILKPHLVSDKNPLPETGIDMIEALVDAVLAESSAWIRRRPMSLQDIWSRFVKPEYQESIELYEYINNLLLELRTQLKEFIGKDIWIMHFKVRNKFEILVEKTIDYRIYQWHQEHAWEFKTDHP